MNDVELLAALIHSEFENYGLDKDDAEKLAQKLVNIGWHLLDSALESRVARLERYAQGLEVSWT